MELGSEELWQHLGLHIPFRLCPLCGPRASLISWTCPLPLPLTVPLFLVLPRLLLPASFSSLPIKLPTKIDFILLLTLFTIQHHPLTKDHKVGEMQVLCIPHSTLEASVASQFSTHPILCLLSMLLSVLFPLLGKPPPPLCWAISRISGHN